MPKLFISYRRGDSGYVAERICDKLASHFSRGSIFFDVDSIPAGADFRSHIQTFIKQTQVLIAVIGPEWSSIKFPSGSKAGTRRIDDPEDLLRIELETAIADGVPVFPLLVKGAAMPSKEELPQSLWKLSDTNAPPVSEGRDFHPSMDRIIDDLEALLKDDAIVPYETARDAAVESLRMKINFRGGEFNSDAANLAVAMLMESGGDEGRKLLKQVNLFTSGQLNEPSFVAWLKAEKKRQTNVRAKRKAQADRKRRAIEAADREQEAQDEAELKGKAEEDAKRKLQAEREQQARELEKSVLQAEREQQARELAELKLQAERERRAREDAERKLREAEERQAREEDARKLQAEREHNDREDAARKLRMEREQQVREEAASKLQAERERLAREEAQNLLRWEHAGLARKWVEDHRGQWSHADWLGLLEGLKRTEFWPMQPEAIGRVLEEEKRGEAMRRVTKAELERHVLAAKTKAAAEAQAKIESDRLAKVVAEKKAAEAHARLEAEQKMRAEATARAKAELDRQAQAEAARVKAEAEANAARLEAERIQLEASCRAAEAEATRVKAAQEELAKLQPTLKILALLDGKEVTGAKVTAGENTWETPIVLRLAGVTGDNYHFTVSYEDLSGYEFIAELEIAATWTGEHTENVVLLPRGGQDLKRKLQAEERQFSLWTSQQASISANEHFLKGHWEFAAMEFDKLLAAGHSLAEYGPKLVTCLLNAHEYLSDSDVPRIEALLLRMEQAGLDLLTVPLRLQFKAKQSAAARQKSVWNFLK